MISTSFLSNRINNLLEALKKYTPKIKNSFLLSFFAAIFFVSFAVLDSQKFDEYRKKMKV